MNTDKLYYFADLANAELIVTRYPQQGGRFSAHFKNCEIKENGMLIGTYGDGKTPNDAIKDYYKKIQGKNLVFDAMRDSRKELYFPND